MRLSADIECEHGNLISLFVRSMKANAEIGWLFETQLP